MEAVETRLKLNVMACRHQRSFLWVVRRHLSERCPSPTRRSHCPHLVWAAASLDQLSGSHYYVLWNFGRNICTLDVGRCYRFGFWVPPRRLLNIYQNTIAPPLSV